MKYTEDLAADIARRFKISPVTLRVWKNRGKIPDRYAENRKRVLLGEVLPINPINTAIEKYGIELERLLESRKFKSGQKDNYYRTCLVSLCREAKTFNEKSCQ